MSVAALALSCALQGAELPALDNRRFPEDYRHLDAVALGDPWWARFKDVPLDEDGKWRFSFGLELRAQSETFRGDGLREVEDEGLDYIWWRALPVFEVRRGEWRAFTQLVFAAASGLDEEPSPIDADGGDVLQGFVEAPLGGGHSLRAGRQLLAFGSQRLVAYRYGPNIPLPFDSVLVEGDAGATRWTALWARPVEIEAGALDNQASSGESLFGLYTTTDVGLGALDAYWLGHRERDGVYQAGTADENRHTFGLRWFGERHRFDWNGEVFHQIGDFGALDIEAWSATIEAGFRPGGEEGGVRVLTRLSYIGGDDDPNDGRLGTFDPLYPRGKYFGEIGTIGPSNLIDVLVGAQCELEGGFALEASSTAYWRASDDDGIYANNGFLLRRGDTSDERFVGVQGDIALTRNVTREFSWTVGWSVLDGGAFLEDTGPSSPLHFFQVATRLQF